MSDLLQLLANNAVPLIDICLVAAAVYYLLVVLKALRNQTLVLLFALLTIFYLLCKQLNLHAMGFLLEKLLLLSPVLLIVVFAPEIRKLIGGLGRQSKFWRDFVPGSEGRDESIPSDAFAAVIDASRELAERKTGAIIVLQQLDLIDDLAISGTVLDAIISSRLLASIFDRHNPLHDGAVIIAGGRVVQAGCFLPISEATALPEFLGTRHRAALGLAERCDAVVVVVSEERGTLSISHRGRIALDLTQQQFREQLAVLLESNSGLATFSPREAIG